MFAVFDRKFWAILSEHNAIAFSTKFAPPQLLPVYVGTVDAVQIANQPAKNSLSGIAYPNQRGMTPGNHAVLVGVQDYITVKISPDSDFFCGVERIIMFGIERAVACRRQLSEKSLGLVIGCHNLDSWCYPASNKTVKRHRNIGSDFILPAPVPDYSDRFLWLSIGLSVPDGCQEK